MQKFFARISSAYIFFEEIGKEIFLLFKRKKKKRKIVLKITSPELILLRI